MTRASISRPVGKVRDDNRQWNEGQAGIGTATTTVLTTFGVDTAGPSAFYITIDGDTGAREAVPLEVRYRDSVPEEYHTHYQTFPSGRDAPVIAERYDDGAWVASLQEDETVFSAGESFPDALANLIASARDDLDILREYDDRVDPSLVGKRQLLEPLFD